MFMPALQGHQEQARLDRCIWSILNKFPLLERRPHCVTSYSVLHQRMLSRRNGAELHGTVNDTQTEQRGLDVSWNSSKV